MGGTSVCAESMAFIHDVVTREIYAAGMVGICFLVHHTSAVARKAFEEESGLAWEELGDFVGLVSIPKEGEDGEVGLGMTLLVCACPSSFQSHGPIPSPLHASVSACRPYLTRRPGHTLVEMAGDA